MMWDWNGPIKIPFRCSDDVIVLVDRKYAGEFKALHIDEIHEYGTETPLPNVSSKILKMIVEYCDNHIPAREHREAAMAVFAAMGGAEYELKLEELEMMEEYDKEKAWLEYSELDYRTLVQLSNAANFLNYQEFLTRMRDALTAKVERKGELHMTEEDRAMIAAELDKLDNEPLRCDMDILCNELANAR
ncbi:SKP1-like protein 1A [Aristolochia californica]|uniref:SKP1-like protein 1A n=1 Tax=Aristolochia californica TaxID=171875 RepID=UPI0035DF68F0